MINGIIKSIILYILFLNICLFTFMFFLIPFNIKKSKGCAKNILPAIYELYASPANTPEKTKKCIFFTLLKYLFLSG